MAAKPPASGGSAAEQRKKAWGSVGRIMREVFDVPGVLRGQKPASALIGMPHVLGSLGVSLVQMWSRGA